VRSLVDKAVRACIVLVSSPPSALTEMSAARKKAVAFVANHLQLVGEHKSKKKQMIFLLGAGISVACGIPDFRSKGGMYDTLKPELLSCTPEQEQAMREDPTMVVQKKMFDVNQVSPSTYVCVCVELITLSHSHVHLPALKLMYEWGTHHI
jgi:hypothetical protein